VVHDRERWFQIVMGQTFKFDEATSEDLTYRVALPDDLAARLSFKISQWSPEA